MAERHAQVGQRLASALKNCENMLTVCDSVEKLTESPCYVVGRIRWDNNVKIAKRHRAHQDILSMARMLMSGLITL